MRDPTGSVQDDAWTGRVRPKPAERRQGRRRGCYAGSTVHLLRVALALILTAGITFGATLVFAQVAVTLVFRDVPPLTATLFGALAAILSAAVAAILVRVALPRGPRRDPPAHK